MKSALVFRAYGWVIGIRHTGYLRHPVNSHSGNYWYWILFQISVPLYYGSPAGLVNIPETIEGMYI